MGRATLSTFGRIAMIAVMLFIVGAISVWAQSQDDGDAPDHGVARISLVNGEVSVAHGDSGDMVAASPNAPMVAGDRILTGDNARAEVQFDAVNLMRVAPGTEVRLGDLQYHHYIVQVAQGLVMFRVLQDVSPENAAQVEISTPSVSLRPRRQGIYRVVVRPDGTSELTVRAGDAEIFAPTGSEPLGPGQTIISRGSTNDPEFQNVTPPPYDEWDRWSADRDRVFERAADTSRYVSPDVYGTEDLGNYGRWTNDPEYGNVWVPNVDADWAPYRLGRWSWVDYYGWSWVSYDPWGWAPYHYGRWYRGNFGWAWYPGTVGERYYWRPALVGFFGWGSPGFGTSISFGFGNVGWVPLAPHEAFRPWYGRGYGGRNVTIVNNTNIGKTYRNGRFGEGVTSMRAGDFGRGAIRNGSGFVRANGEDLAHAGVMRGTPFGPSREGRQFVARDVNTRGMPRTNDNMQFFSSQRGQGGTFSRGTSSQGGGSQNAPRGPAFQGGSAGGSQAGSQADRGGFRRFDAASPNNNSGAVASPRQDTGFRSFDAAAPRNDGSTGFSSPRTEGFRGSQRNENAPRNDNAGQGQGGFRRFGGDNGNAPGNQPSQRLDNPRNSQEFSVGGGQSNIDRPRQQSRPPEQNRNFDQGRGVDRGAQDRGVGGSAFGRPRESEPVRIAPPIVTNRNEPRNEFRSAPPSGNGPAFGGARPGFGGGAQNAPQGGANGGGGVRGNPGGGGAPRGGGSGGGQRGGNGGHGGGRSR